MSKIKLKPIFESGASEHDGLWIPYSKIHSEYNNPVFLNGEFLAGVMFSLYDLVISTCPEEYQIQFEKDFKDYFDRHWESKEKSSSKVKISQD